MSRVPYLLLPLACTALTGGLAAQPATKGQWGAAAAPVNTMLIEAPAGGVVVSSWERDSIDVTGSVATALRVVTSSDSSTWRWVALPRDSIGATLPRLALQVRVPRRMSVRLQVVDGDIRLRGLRGRATVNVVAGRVEVRDHAAPLEVDAIDAVIIVDRTSAAARVHTSTGAVALAGVHGPVDIATVSAPVTLSGMRGGGQVRTIGGAVTVREPLLPGDTLVLQTHDAPILLQVPPARSPVIDAEIVSQQRVPVRFTQSRADGTLVARSFRGRITLMPWPASDRVPMANGRR